MLTDDEMKPLIDQLIIDEGSKPYPYSDKTGYRVWAPTGNITIGIGRNLDAVDLSMDEQIYLCKNDIRRAEKSVSILPFYNKLDMVRKMALLNMGFNLGYEKLDAFKRMLAALKESDWVEASEEMLNSKWATQVGDRAQRLAFMMKTGKQLKG